MKPMTISSKYRVTIPKDVREQLKLVPGQKMQMLALGGRILALPVRPIDEYRGFFSGIDASIERDQDDRV